MIKCHIYNHLRETSVNKVRGMMLKDMVGENEVISCKSKVDLSLIPPCQDSLIPHLQRVNYRVAAYRRAAEQFWAAPEPYAQGQGWEIGTMAFWNLCSLRDQCFPTIAWSAWWKTTWRWRGWGSGRGRWYWVGFWHADRCWVKLTKIGNRCADKILYTELMIHIGYC